MNAPVDTSKLRDGDVVHVRGEVFANPKGYVDGLSVRFSQITFAALKNVEIVSVEPRPLAVGDKVRSARIGEGFTILAIDGPVGWLKHVDGERYTGPLSELERVEP